MNVVLAHRCLPENANGAQAPSRNIVYLCLERIMSLSTNDGRLCAPEKQLLHRLPAGTPPALPVRHAWPLQSVPPSLLPPTTAREAIRS